MLVRGQFATYVFALHAPFSVACRVFYCRHRVCHRVCNRPTYRFTVRWSEGAHKTFMPRHFEERQTAP